MARKNSTFKHNFVVGAGTALGLLAVAGGVMAAVTIYNKVKEKVSSAPVTPIGSASYQSMPGASYQQTAQGQYY